MLKEICKLGELTLMKNYKEQERTKHTLKGGIICLLLY